MKCYMLLMCLYVNTITFGQTEIRESFPLQGARSIELNFKWPQVVRLSTGEGNDISIKGKVLINNGRFDENFKIVFSRTEDKLEVSSEIRDLENLPDMILVRRDGLSHYLDETDWDSQKLRVFVNDERGYNEYVTRGVIKEIELEIIVPKGPEVVINSKYGLIEITDFENDLEANSKYGGIDMAFNKERRLNAKTRHGEIYSDLPYDLKVNDREPGEDKWTVVDYDGKAGSAYLESKYANIFLRKGN